MPVRTLPAVCRAASPKHASNRRSAAAPGSPQAGTPVSDGRDVT
jgi:hypothetical protein